MSHASLIQYQCSALRRPHWSKVVYVDQMANLATGKRRTGLVHGPWEGFQCMGTKDTTKPTGKRPRAHSEIAALEDMFDIPANADMDQWVTQILTFYDPATRGFPTLCGNERSHGRLHAQILNSQHPPCGVVVDGQERTFRGYEMPCLEELVSRVRKAIGPFLCPPLFGKRKENES